MSQCCDHNIQPDGLSFQTGEGCIPCPVGKQCNATVHSENRCVIIMKCIVI